MTAREAMFLYHGLLIGQIAAESGTNEAKIAPLLEEIVDESTNELSATVAKEIEQAFERVWAKAARDKLN